MKKNIVITGAGIISAIGNCKESVLESLKKQKTGIEKIKILDTVHKDFPSGEVKMTDSQLKSSLEIPQTKLISRNALLGIYAAKEALLQAGINKENKNGKKIFFISGTTVGGMDLTEKFYKDFPQNTECLKQHDSGSCTDLTAEYFGIFDNVITISTACSSAANALILASRLIKAGKADIVVAGGAEALTKFHLNGFNSLMIIDKEICRPFDQNRAGLNLGEGAAYVVLETSESAKSRNATPLTYLVGGANTCDAFHQTASSPEGEGAYNAMKQALEEAGLSPWEIDYINAHGTGTPNNDESESQALKRIFSDQIPLFSSTKSLTGHTTSASGAIESVICILAMQNNFAPGNLGFETKMENFDFSPIKENTPKILKNVICNSFGFGGNDSSLIFSINPPKENAKDFVYNEEIKLETPVKVEINSEEELSKLKNFLKPAESRRLCKIMKTSLLTSLEALSKAGIQTPDAIITATTLGCWENSEKLLEQITFEGEEMLKPTLFMQSTHNTIGSNIAIKTGCKGYNITYTQGENSMKCAMEDAVLLLKSGMCKNVLIGLHDETTKNYRELTTQTDLPEIHSVAIIIKTEE